ncbi:NADP-dependent oxidoreductase [Cryobacterium roopkundense]|uniref:NADPH:quinone reductase-like Zn-dependent oxidoreductase n=1 Tax=Cryobacterium roopkundense TaxID=1001240 RepID=A0A7W9E370_9MICO|nr:NADP-dependent oxidoreductase [Cryobacterium roopkundense]MBB5640059.1 NADPH:quinone reductase-like Zn-dependent oxidoreductase [Cryobacterium roopkundense]
MPYRVQFSEYGGPDVLELVDMLKPVAGPGDVVVEVLAAGLNPGESSIREGRFALERPVRFPQGQGSDFAGVVVGVGDGVETWHLHDEVLGHTVRAAQASYVAVPEGNVIRKPSGLPWEIAGSLFVAAATAWQAVQGVNPGPGRTVLVHAAAGGVGGIAGQLCKLRGATVIGTCSRTSFDYLRQHRIIPVEYGADLDSELARVAPGGIDAELNRMGDDALVTVNSTDTVVLERIASMVANHQISIPLAAVYPLERVQDAYRELEAGHAHGKIVLSLEPVYYRHQKVQAIDIRETEATRDAPGRTPGPPAHEVLPPVFGHRRHKAPSAPK